MRKIQKIPRIIKIEDVNEFVIQCMFNNGESRKLDFERIFADWNVKKGDFEYKLLDKNEFEKVKLRNYTLSWPNIEIKLKSPTGDDLIEPYEIGADVLYNLSNPIDKESGFQFGLIIRNARIKAGMTQHQLAMRSGTSRFYISRLENDKTDVELSTFRKIIEAGLGKHLRMIIE